MEEPPMLAQSERATLKCKKFQRSANGAIRVSYLEAQQSYNMTCKQPAMKVRCHCIGYQKSDVTNERNQGRCRRRLPLSECHQPLVGVPSSFMPGLA
jgi:hypothetical protein